MEIQKSVQIKIYNYQRSHLSLYSQEGSRDSEGWFWWWCGLAQVCSLEVLVVKWSAGGGRGSGADDL